MHFFTLFIICLIFTYCDLKYRKINNYLTYSLVFVITIIHIISFGTAGLLNSLLGFTVGMIVCILPHKFQFCGFGEYKVLGTIGCMTGFIFTFKLGLIIYCLAFILWIANLILCGKLSVMTYNIVNNFERIIICGISIVTIYDECQVPRIPFTLIISTACLICITI